jgi:hypothetical protein
MNRVAANVIAAVVRNRRRFNWDSFLTEREAIDLDAAIEEFDRARSIDDRTGLSNQLIGTLFDESAVALRVEVSAMRGTRRLAIDPHSNARR